MLFLLDKELYRSYYFKNFSGAKSGCILRELISVQTVITRFRHRGNKYVHHSYLRELDTSLFIPISKVSWINRKGKTSPKANIEDLEPSRRLE